KSAQSRPTAAPRESGQILTQPVLVKGSPTNYWTNGFDISWVDNSTQKYYLADRTNNAIDLVDAATDTFLGFIGRGEYTGSKPCRPPVMGTRRRCSPSSQSRMGGYWVSTNIRRIRTAWNNRFGFGRPGGFTRMSPEPRIVSMCSTLTRSRIR